MLTFPKHDKAAGEHLPGCIDDDGEVLGVRT